MQSLSVLDLDNSNVIVEVWSNIEVLMKVDLFYGVFSFILVHNVQGKVSNPYNVYILREFLQAVGSCQHMVMTDYGCTTPVIGPVSSLNPDCGLPGILSWIRGATT